MATVSDTGEVSGGRDVTATDAAHRLCRPSATIHAQISEDTGIETSRPPSVKARGGLGEGIPGPRRVPGTRKLEPADLATVAFGAGYDERDADGGDHIGHAERICDLGRRRPRDPRDRAPPMTTFEIDEHGVLTPTSGAVRPTLSFPEASTPGASLFANSSVENVTILAAGAPANECSSPAEDNYLPRRRPRPRS